MDVTREEVKELIIGLRAEVKRDMELAIAQFKNWLLIAVLSNTVLIGGPALYVFFNTTTAAQSALTVSISSRERIDSVIQWGIRTDSRLSTIERHLQDKTGFSAPTPAPLPK